MSPVHLRNQSEDIPGLFRGRRPGSGHHNRGRTWRGLEGYGSSSSAPFTPQRSILMEHGQQSAQASFTLHRTGSILHEGMFQIDTLQRSYGNHQIMESQHEV
ncbi:hypothetical protein O181_014354 [Austropuccinia psidii MF-1]|uniref:Uncharacterized protein n=1 Tax=Austropuccinia psidii MF-1 TaxID=1389203 RepID=A0A9Q3GPS2_9BASI|nr:hypothetical protein [Austropuccinia psidii MF-1]